MLPAIFIFLFTAMLFRAEAATKNSTSSGNWNNPSSWLPAGIPNANDNVVIQSNHAITIDNNADVNSIVINSGAELKFLTGKNLSINDALTVNGKMTMNNGDIHFNSASEFALGPNSVFTWDPFTNTASGATLFTKGIEQFDSTSTLIIKKWYDYASVPLGSVVSGNFGNVVLNSISNGLLYEWNQDNKFESHKILGTLSIEQGWVVLDKSGTINNTSIGNINLLTPNAFLDFHSGTHPGSFVVNTKSIINTGGEINGIYNGNGNVTLNVASDFTNLGNVALIYNTGVFGVGNGNVTMNVGENYNQSFGDFRAIFNLTTTNSGISNLTFKNINLTGGIMMAQYACHTSSAVCNFKVTGNLNINFSNSTDKFRVVGLTSLSGIFNNAKSNLIVNGNFSISGNSAGEFTSSGGVGIETVSISGNASFSGGPDNFNMGSHQTIFNTNGDLILSGGTVCLSKSPGETSITIGGNFTQNEGSFSIKGQTGTADMTINGNFLMANGKAYLHNNSFTTSADPVNLTIHGDFNHSGGTINYDDNPSTTAVNNIYINGSEYSVSGNGLITHSGEGTSHVFGMLYFSRQGTVSYKSNSSHTIQQVKQVINSGCALDISTGNLQVSSHSSASCDYFKVLSGGTLSTNAQKIVSNGLAANSGITIDNGARIILQHKNGLYNGTEDACISSESNMNYFLAPESVVEYSGTDHQILTGTGQGLTNASSNKYGILEINLQQDEEKVSLSASNVFVRKELRLTKGELDLNNNILTIESGSPFAITRTSGYVRSETNLAYNQSIIKWLNVANGKYEFPFGVSSHEYIPFYFTPVSGAGAVSIATRSTGIDNAPFPNGGNLPHVNNLYRNNVDISESSVIDRWYDIIATGFKANVTVSYRGAENTTADSLTDADFSIQAWDGSNWSHSMGSGTGIRNGIGSITATNVTVFGHWMLSTTSTTNSENDPVENTPQINQDFSIVSIIPNPFKDNFTLTFLSPKQNSTELLISSVNGQVTLSEQISTMEGINIYKYFEKQNLPQGIYVLTLRNGGSVVSKKIFKG